MFCSNQCDKRPKTDFDLIGDSFVQHRSKCSQQTDLCRHAPQKNKTGRNLARFFAKKVNFRPKTNDHTR